LVQKFEEREQLVESPLMLEPRTGSLAAETALQVAFVRDLDLRVQWFIEVLMFERFEKNVQPSASVVKKKTFGCSELSPAQMDSPYITLHKT
jgi:hypothetical protein